MFELITFIEDMNSKDIIYSSQKVQKSKPYNTRDNILNNLASYQIKIQRHLAKTTQK